jgi:hypothetical protein
LNSLVQKKPGTAAPKLFNIDISSAQNSNVYKKKKNKKKKNKKEKKKIEIDKL